jgi:5-methyltetrahydrofolate--homocysteine methyltransferase
MQHILEEIRHCVVNVEVGRSPALVKEALERGVPAYEIFIAGLSKGMDVVGQKYEAGEYFLSELLGAAQVVKEAMEELSPHLQREQTKRIGSVVIGTVRGDIHDIGKNIVKMLLLPAGFKVYDLETDVPAEEFAEKADETTADIVAMSSLLTTTMGEMKTNVRMLERSGLRKKVKIIVGGAPITDEFAREIGADAAGRDAAHGVRICKEWMRRA